MNNTLISVLIGIVVIGGIGGFVYWQKNASMDSDAAGGTWETGSPLTDDDTDTATTTDGTASTADNSSADSSGITPSQVALHSSSTDCWSSINGNVYDLTSWIPNHPGGPDKIIQLCGKDGSEKFNGKHGGAAKQATVLAGFKIGVLAN